MFQVVTKENGKNVVKNIADGIDVKNLRYAIYELLRIKNISVDELASSIEIDPLRIDQFLKADPSLNGDLPLSLCRHFNLDQSDYLPGYFQENV